MRRPVTSRHGTETRHGREKLARIDLPGTLKNIDRRAGFDNPAVAHDHDAVSHLSNDAHIMGDQHDRRAEFALKLSH